MNLSTFTARAAAALVALIAGFISWGHIVSVAAAAGESRAAAMVLPAAIDGLIVVATMAMIEDRRRERKPRFSARVALGVGVAMTLAANLASAEPTWVARAVAVVPAVSFLIAVEVLARSGRQLAAVDDNPPPVEVVAPQVEPPAEHAEPDTNAGEKRAARRGLQTAQRVAKAAQRNPRATAAELAARLRVSERTVQRYLPAPAVDTVTTTNGHGG